MRMRCPRPVRSERGASAVVATLIALVLFGLAALTVDLGNAVARKGDTQIQADFAALAGAKELPGEKTATDPSVVAVADYIWSNSPQDDRSAAWAGSATAVAQNLVDGNDSNGEVYFPETSKLQVISPLAQVNFALAGVFSVFGGGVTNQIDVGSDATVLAGTPKGYGVLPMYVAAPTPGNPGCDYGIQTLTDPPGGQVVPPTVPTLYADTDTNNTDLDDITVYDSGVPVTTLLKDTTTGSIRLQGDFDDAIKVGFFRSDNASTPPVEVEQASWTDPAGLTVPYDKNNGFLSVPVPPSVTAVEKLWYVRVYQGGTSGGNANKWSDRTEAQPVSVGDAPYECIGGSQDGNFGTLKMPRSTMTSTWIPRNIAYGLEAPLSLAIMPGSPPPYMCSSATPGAVISTASNRKPGTNCLDTDTGMTENDATEGFITGPGSNDGLLATGSSSADPDGTGGCSRAGNTSAFSVNGRQLNDDLLTCFLIDETTQLGDVARRNYSGEPKFHPDIYNSPRFSWVPVFQRETLQGGSNKYSIIDFRPAFIADQPMTATKGNNAVNSGTENGLGFHSNKLRTLKVIFLNVDALPDGDAATPIGPNLGPNFPIVTRLID